MGFGDTNKLDQHNLALFPMCDNAYSENSYKGNEYLEIYPHIVYRDETTTYSDRKIIPRGYYVRSKNNNGKFCIKSLDKRLEK